MTLLVALGFSFSAMASSSMRGDVNGDQFVDINDVTALITCVLGGDASGMDMQAADITGEGAVDINDVTSLISYVLTGQWPFGDETFTVGGVTFIMKAVEGGSFMMGATAEQGIDASSRERPVHRVTLTSYHIGQTEVTQELWMAVMGGNPGYFVGSRFPVEQVTWEDCQLFIAALNEMTNRNFRLPTEAEWEFAARGGNDGQGYKYSGSNDLPTVAWYSYNDSWETRGSGYYGTHEVATRNPNELQIYDMSGNVHEWCQDRYGDYSSGEQMDPTGPATGTNRVYRGGNWLLDDWFCRVSFRNGLSPSNSNYGIGLRLAL